jgi:hypothetical protein
MRKEIIQIDNKIEIFYDKKVLGTFKIISNSLTGEFILFSSEEDSLGFCLMECCYKNVLQKESSRHYITLSNIIGEELYEHQEDILSNLVN